MAAFEQYQQMAERLKFKNKKKIEKKTKTKQSFQRFQKICVRSRFPLITFIHLSLLSTHLIIPDALIVFIYLAGLFQCVSKEQKIYLQFFFIFKLA